MICCCISELEFQGYMHHRSVTIIIIIILQVFHGSDMDVEWLQRDLGLYVVNMFDTGQASRVLGLARHSLSYLLAHYCSVQADKQFQLADWRIRYVNPFSRHSGTSHRAQWLRGRTTDSRLREPGFEFCAAV